MDSAKKTIVKMLIVAIFLIKLFIVHQTSYAQELGTTEFSKKYNEYKLSFEVYNSSHAEYILARENYLKFRTLTSQTNAQTATKKMLRDRDEVLIDYYEALRERINETKGISDDRKNELMQRLTDEKNWLSEHQTRVSQAGTLSELEDISDEARDRYVELEGFLYRSLYNISEGKINDFRSRLIVIFEDVKSKVEQIKGERREEYVFSDQKIETMERWISETEARIARSEEEQVEAVTSSERITNSGTFRGSIKELEDVRKLLQDASIFVKEIIREIKIAE